MACHDRNERAGGHIFPGDPVGEPGDAESRQCRGNERRAVVRLEAPLRADRDDRVAILELPGFGPLHESLMVDELLRRLGGAMRFDIVRARDQLSMDRPDVSRDQVGVREVADPDRAIDSPRR